MAGKRYHGEGTVRQLKSGSWNVQLMVGYSPEGKKKIKSFTASTKKGVLEKMHNYLEQKRTTKLDDEISLKDWSNQWYSGYQDQVQPSTYCNYKYTLKIIQKYFGDRKLNEILPLDIEQFLRKIGTDYSDSYVNKCRAMLIQIYDEADANGLVSRNPARRAKKVRKVQSTVSVQNSPDQKSAKKDSFTKAEVERLLAGLELDLLGYSIRLMLGTGLRVQELLALTKADISEDGAAITVNKAIKTVDGKSTLGPPKSTRSNRVVPVPASYRESAVYLRKHGREPFIWTASWKNPLYNTKTFRSRYYRAVKQIDGVRLLSPHCCRHTYITRLEELGVPMEQIARLVGHSKIETTDRYLHTSTDTLAASVAVLDNSEGRTSNE